MSLTFWNELHDKIKLKIIIFRRKAKLTCNKSYLLVLKEYPTVVNWSFCDFLLLIVMIE